MTIWEHSTKANIIVTSPHETIESAIMIFSMHDFHHLPIVDEREVMGLLTVPTLLQGMLHEGRIETVLQDPVQQWMNTRPTMVPQETTWKQALQMILPNKDGALIITKAKTRYIQGIFTLRDVLLHANQRLASKFQDERIGNAMSRLNQRFMTKVVTITADTSFYDAMRIMSEEEADYLLATTREHIITSIITHDSIIHTFKRLLEMSELTEERLQEMTVEEGGLRNFLSLTKDINVGTVINMLVTSNLNIGLLLKLKGELDYFVAEREITQFLLL